MSITINGTTGVSGVDGTAATPAVQGNDSNTGVFFPAADTVAITTSGTERMRVDSSGNVGIGTSSLGATLTVAASSVNAGQIIRNTSAAASTSKTSFIQFQGTDTVGTTKETGDIYVLPSDNNYISSEMRFYTRSADAAYESVRLGSIGQIGLSGANYGTSGQVLTSSGSGAAPSWTSAALGSTTVTNKTGSRATATTYQNTTNGWLLVCFSMSNNGVTFLIGATSGLGITAMSSNFSGNVQTYLVPPGWYYRATGTVLSNWTEGQA